VIRSKADYKAYLAADKAALRVTDSLRDRFFHPIWNYQKLLRLLEYRLNCKHGLLSKPYTLWVRYKFQKESVRLGFSISPNSCGKGLELGHYGDIVINGKARIGKNCTIAGAGVLIGEDLKNPSAPIIGDNCYIGPGAKIIGGVRIAEGVTIAANAVVVHDIIEPYTTVGGIPAKKISDSSVKKNTEITY
jgi:serine O-acetyltransferase